MVASHPNIVISSFPHLCEIYNFEPFLKHEDILPIYFHLEIIFKFPLTFINLEFQNYCVNCCFHLSTSILSCQTSDLNLRLYHFKGYSEFDVYQKNKYLSAGIIITLIVVNRHIFLWCLIY